jgi:hypothetical protein
MWGVPSGKGRARYWSARAGGRKEWIAAHMVCLEVELASEKESIKQVLGLGGRVGTPEPTRGSGGGGELSSSRGQKKKLTPRGPVWNSKRSLK